MFLLLFVYAPKFVAVAILVADAAADVFVGVSLEVSIEIAGSLWICASV